MKRLDGCCCYWWCCRGGNAQSTTSAKPLAARIVMKSSKKKDMTTNTTKSTMEFRCSRRTLAPLAAATIARKLQRFVPREPTTLAGQADDDHAAVHKEHADA